MAEKVAFVEEQANKMLTFVMELRSLLRLAELEGPETGGDHEVMCPRQDRIGNCAKCSGGLTYAR